MAGWIPSNEEHDALAMPLLQTMEPIRKRPRLSDREYVLQQIERGPRWVPKALHFASEQLRSRSSAV